MAEHERRQWLIAVAAFLLSLVVAIVSFGNVIVGPQIDVLPPESVFLYREGNGNSSVVSIAIRLRMINRAASYNDVVIASSLFLSGESVRFDNSSRVSLIFTENRDSRSVCAPGARCIARRGMAITELQDDMVVIPAGGASGHFFSYRLVCGGGRDCQRYRDVGTTLRTLRNKELDLIILIQLNQDGARIVRCRAGPIDAKDFPSRGWQGLRCNRSTVSGAHRYSLF